MATRVIEISTRQHDHSLRKRATLNPNNSMTLFPFVYSERTRTPNLRPMTAEVQRHWQQSRVTSVADPDCIRLDIWRWENEGGALIEDKRPPVTTPLLHCKQ
jgi:hypothetical protein